MCEDAHVLSRGCGHYYDLDIHRCANAIQNSTTCPKPLERVCLAFPKACEGQSPPDSDCMFFLATKNHPTYYYRRARIVVTRQRTSFLQYNTTSVPKPPTPKQSLRVISKHFRTFLETPNTLNYLPIPLARPVSHRIHILSPW